MKLSRDRDVEILQVRFILTVYISEWKLVYVCNELKIEDFFLPESEDFYYSVCVLDTN